MTFIYNLIAHIAWFHLKLFANVSPKMKLFVEGRKETFSKIEKGITKKDQVIWMHVASLGEFEQGLPIIEKIRIEKPSHKILVTFFSPSGYEVKKNSPAADVIVYLPLDTRQNVKRFLDSVHPELAIFIKYEIWPNYLVELKTRAIPTLLVAAIFKKEQLYFKWYGNFMRKALMAFSHIFVQDEKSMALLSTIQINNTSISGDTRLDRVSEILERDNTLPLIAAFKRDTLCLVAGSTWAEDEALLVDFINNSHKKLKYILAPHKIEKDKIFGLAGAISKKTVLFSNSDINTISTYDVLIIDNIGMLTKIYNYADIAYVGGGFSTGLHNTLEPAVFGIPVVIGPNFEGFKEAEDLVALKGIHAIHDSWSFNEVLKKLLSDPALRSKIGARNATYITKNKGASIQIMDHVRTLY